MLLIGAGAFLTAGIGQISASAIQANYWYKSTVSSDANGFLDLLVELNYDDTIVNAPIAVVMHGYGGEVSDVRPNALRLRDRGFFTLSVAMRQRNGSDGVFDSGGLEIYDIYDAVEAVKRDYSAYVDPDTVYITGYSGGGGNVMSALTKFPDTFTVGAAFFGMSDYGYDEIVGWWFNTSNPTGDRNSLTSKIGDRATGDPAILDKYMARASYLASMNNPYTEIHLFTNLNETRVPIIHIRAYRDQAVAAASFSGEFDNITVHEGSGTLYEDFNDNGINEPDERQYWPHRYPLSDEQISAESWFLERLLAGDIKEPALAAADSLFVAGYVKTARFECWVGDGQNGAATLNYSLSPLKKEFVFQIQSLEPTLGGWISVDTSDMNGKLVTVRLNGAVIDTFTGGGDYRIDTLADGDVLELTVAHTQFKSPRLSVDGANWVIQVSSLPGFLYQLYHNSDLHGVPADWKPEGEPVMGNGQLMSLIASRNEFPAEPTIFFVVQETAQ